MKIKGVVKYGYSMNHKDLDFISAAYNKNPKFGGEFIRPEEDNIFIR